MCQAKWKPRNWKKLKTTAAWFPIWVEAGDRGYWPCWGSGHCCWRQTESSWGGNRFGYTGWQETLFCVTTNIFGHWSNGASRGAERAEARALPGVGLGLLCSFSRAVKSGRVTWEWTQWNTTVDYCDPGACLGILGVPGKRDLGGPTLNKTLHPPTTHIQNTQI